MSLIIASHDSLPYIEPAPTPSELSTIASLLAAELPPDHLSTPHPSLPASYEPVFTTAFQEELGRVSANQPLMGGIDLSRYDPPSVLPSDEEEARTALQQAYAASTHLAARNTNLTLLSEFGKNAWLIHNSQLEQILKSLEEELMALKAECEVVNKERKAAQMEVKGTIEGLEAKWKRSVGTVLEVEVAAEGLRREILRRRREGAGGM
ncbi:hypothetical protein RUND412_002257 [Rhizina undulata]